MTDCELLLPPINTLTPEQNVCSFVHSILKCIFGKAKISFQFKFRWSLFLRVRHWLWRRLQNKPLPEATLTMNPYALCRQYSRDVHFHTALGYIVLSIIITINSNGLGSSMFVWRFACLSVRINVVSRIQVAPFDQSSPNFTQMCILVIARNPFIM